MKELTLARIAEFTGGICPTGSENIRIDDICRDSRACREGSLFVPLPGANFDGHDFIISAVKNGASAVIASKDVDIPVPVLRVKDTLDAYQAIAAGYKSLFKELKTVGITGSVGKTTTTKMTACVLSRAYRLHITQEDNNGQRGLPASVLQLDDKAQIALLEMGMSMPGELRRLSVMAKPDIAVINGIGTAHIEFFGTRENICKAKLEITDGMSGDGLLILNGDDDLLWAKRGTYRQKVIYYGVENRECDILGDIVSINEGSTSFNVIYKGQTETAVLPAVGLHNALDALAAVSVGLALGIGLSDACASLTDYVPAHGRGNIYRKDGFVIMDDCYNASPEAVKASLGVLESLSASRRFACLGDMLELGEKSALYHKMCGAYAAEKADFLLACGEQAQYYILGAVEAGMDKADTAYFTDQAEAAVFLRTAAKQGDALLFKGSHGSHMEKMLEAFFAEDPAIN